MTRPLPPVDYTQPMLTDDTTMGAKFVYCRSHLRPHSTGWCSVPTYHKVALDAETIEDALTEVRSYGWLIHGEHNR
jgi:hypothetical protein